MIRAVAREMLGFNDVRLRKRDRYRETQLDWKGGAYCKNSGANRGKRGNIQSSCLYPDRFKIRNERYLARRSRAL
jgi:hypothetical protein